MRNQIQKFVLCLLLACLPLQSVAAPAHALFCGDAYQQDAQAAAHDHAAGDQHSHDSTGDQAGHAALECCHYYFSAIVPGVAADSPQSVAAFEPRSPASLYFVFPKFPERPPLALAA
ncbi:MAG: hypothetical protein HY661_10225 [Betaproteobacteria bacterium]|nr:hypothetical protein [Betaproteobacteria bacterium]